MLIAGCESEDSGKSPGKIPKGSEVLEPESRYINGANYYSIKLDGKYCIKNSGDKEIIVSGEKWEDEFIYSIPHNHFALRITSGYENGADLVEVYFNFDDHIYKTSYKRVQGVYQ